MSQLHEVREDRWSEPEEVTLLQAIATGDQTAMTALYDKTHALVYGLTLRILQEEVAAQDTVLEVYMQVWRQAAQYDPRRGTPMAWLTTITRSRALDRRRAHSQYQRREKPLDMAQHLAAAAPDPAAASVLSEEQRMVQDALRRLPPEQREVIELAYFSGLSHSDIATHLGQPLGTVKTRIRLGMLQLRRRLLPAVGG